MSVLCSINFCLAEYSVSLTLTMSTIEFLDGMKDVLDHYISPLVKLIGIIGEDKFTFPSVRRGKHPISLYL